MERVARHGLGFFVAGVLGVSCGGAPSPASASDEGPPGSSSLAIVGGTASTASQDAVVLVIHDSPTAKTVEVCSGTLLTPRLVLTARHCVATADTESSCSADGTSSSGGVIHSDFAPTEMFVFAGVERPTSTSVLTMSQRGAAIIDDGATTVCNHDLALLLLETDVPNAIIAPVRLDAISQPDETVTLVGWGVTDATSRLPTVRQQRIGSPILGVGPSNALGLGSAEIELGEGACEGDSGGPALAASGAVIGALSRGGNGMVRPGAGACIAGTNVYTATAGFKGLILDAYDRAGQTPWLEGDPNPTLPAPAPAPTGEMSSNQGGCSATSAGGSAGGGAGGVQLFAVALGGLFAARALRRPARRARRAP